ncbi:hypothetical protein N8987_02590 [Crocinitomix sp.]|nr:hypothetical protein [Crocinitomix sp.]
MKDNKHQSPLFSDNKDKAYKTQLQTIFHYLLENVATASMIAESTGIPHKNITRYKRDLEISCRLWETEKRFCQLTGHKAWYLTTNPEHRPENNQLKMFL